MLCKKCLARLNIAYDFKKQAEGSDLHVRSFISDVNKRFQQVTGKSGSSNFIKKQYIKHENSQEGENESYDELDEDMQMLIQDEQESTSYKVLISDVPTEIKPASREQLVEILGENSAITLRKTRSNIPINIENTNDGESQNMEVFIVDDGEVEVEPGYIIEGDEEYDPNSSEMITDEIEAQYLEDDENEELYELVR